MNAVRHWYKQIASSLITKLMMILVLLAVLLAAAFCTLAFGFNVPYLKNVALEMQNRVLTAQEATVSAILRQQNETFYSIAVDANLRSCLQKTGTNASIGRASDSMSIFDILKQYLSLQPDIINLCVVSEDGYVFSYSRSGNKVSNTNLWTGEGEDLLWTIRNQCRGDTRARYYTETRSITSYGSFFHRAVGLRDFYTKENIGVLIVSFSPKSLNQALTYQQEDKILLRNALVTPEGYILACSGGDVIGLTLEKGLDARNSSLSLQTDYIGYNGLEIASTLDMNYLLRDVNNYTAAMVSLIVVLIAAFSALCYAALHRSKESIFHLTKGIEAVESGRLDVVVTPASDDEFGRISDAFTRMVGRLKEMNLTVDRENAARLRALDLQHQAEMVTLESQINSHFLSNTINMISCTAIECQDYEVPRLLKALADCMRYTFDKSLNPPMVRNDLHWLQNYMLLQKERCGKIFDYTIRADDEILDDPIKKLMLQPFIENSIKHGFVGRRFGGLIQLRLRRFRGDWLAISIYDNGIGIPRQKAEDIQAMFDGKRFPNELGIGIENVVLRVQRSYRGARLMIRSTPGAGTKINLFLPPLLGEQHPE